MAALIYVCDDEKNIRDLIKTFLEEEGYQIEVFGNGDSLFETFLEKEPDLIILDVMMPGTDGFSVTAKIRKKSDLPILLLTARDTDADYITGFTAGCDDYFTKPFSPVKLTMRVAAILKRLEKEKSITNNGVFKYADFSLDTGLKSASIGDKEVKLTSTEFEIMEYFLKNKDRAVSRNELLENIWGYDAMVETRVTDDTIKRIRKKLALYESKLKIETVWGFGFKLGEEDV